MKVYIGDVDRHFARAKSEGAKIIGELQDGFCGVDLPGPGSRRAPMGDFVAWPRSPGRVLAATSRSDARSFQVTRLPDDSRRTALRAAKAER